MTLRGQWSLWGAGAERGGLDAGGEGDVVTVTGGGCAARCAVARTPPSCARELPAVSATTNKQWFTDTLNSET